jgi:hypothetical protein
MIVGHGTPSQKSTIWVVEACGFETAQIHRSNDDTCILRRKWADLEPMSPLKMLAEQAE